MKLWTVRRKIAGKCLQTADFPIIMTENINTLKFIFFFTGIKPLCDDNAYLIMHHAGGVLFHLEDLKLNVEFQKIAEYIREENMI